MLQIDFQFTTQPPPSRGAYHNLHLHQIKLSGDPRSSLHIESLPGQGKSLETRREIIEKVSFTHFFWNERTTDPRGKKETLSLYQAPN